MENIVAAVVLGIIALGFYLFSILQLCGKGPLLNNAYLYASAKERESMNKAPHYRQSGIIFGLLGTLFAVLAADALLETGWLFRCGMGLMAVTVLYAIVSSARIEKQSRRP